MILIFTQQISDTFIRANETPLSGGGNWNTINSGILQLVNLSSNAAVQASPKSGLHSQAWWVGGPGLSGDQYAEVTVGTSVSSSGEFIGPIICAVNATDTQYELVLEGPTGASATLILVKRIAGSQTLLGSTVTTTVNTGDKLLLAKQGTNLYVYLNRVQVTGIGTVSDSSLAGGLAGILLQGANPCTITGFTAGNVTVATFVPQIGAFAVGF